MCCASSVGCFLLSLCRPVGFWLSRAQSLLYCYEHGVLGFFSEEVKSCSCPAEQPTCQGVIPCIVGTSPMSCSLCASDNATRCGACHHGNLLHLGSCRPSIAASLDHYLTLDLDMPDAEVLRYVLNWFSNICGPHKTHRIFDYIRSHNISLLVSFCLDTNTGCVHDS